jgi:N-acetyltransferase
MNQKLTTKPPFERQPTLTGELLQLRPLLATEFEALYAVASDPLIWELHPEPTRYQRSVFEKFFQGAMVHGALAVIDRSTGSIVGSSRYYNEDRDTNEVSIGFTFLARSHWGGRVNGELKRLMLDHAFKTYHRIWLHIGPDNFRSRRAAEKIGAVYSHTGPVEILGSTSTTAWYSILASDWSALQA